MAAQPHDDPRGSTPMSGSDKLDDTQSAVERSLEDFIARANTALPPPAAEVAPAVRAISSRRKQKAVPGTLVVVGSQAPLAEETEIVTRFSVEELVPGKPSRSLGSSLKLGLAFLAGAALVLVATRLISGGPKPVKPTAVKVAPAPVVSSQPPIIVVPIPTAELPPPPAAVEPRPVVAEPEARTEKPVEAAARAPRPRPRATPPRKPRPAAASAKPPGGLVDPFAN